MNHVYYCSMVNGINCAFFGSVSFLIARDASTRRVKEMILQYELFRICLVKWELSNVVREVFLVVFRCIQGLYDSREQSRLFSEEHVSHCLFFYFNRNSLYSGPPVHSHPPL